MIYLLKGDERLHCDDATMHHTEKFNHCKNNNFLFFILFARNIDRR